MITEIDISAATDSATERFQAAIWGDYLDVSISRSCVVTVSVLRTVLAGSVGMLIRE